MAAQMVTDYCEKELLWFALIPALKLELDAFQQW
jgi:hypothetical protein